MKTIIRRRRGVIACCALAALSVGCSALRPGGGPATASPGEVSGSEAWSNTCAQCHNSIAPGTFSDQQWDAIVMHMRIHARLTGEEARAIRAFLQASN
ncbi:MAG: hypothetical protein U0637_14025 [Phycisphaerales bacterium]